jgi:HrpA-like RNA helicase
MIGAIDRSKSLTLSGRQMARLPLEPVHARALLSALEIGPPVIMAMISVVSILSATSKLFIDPSDPTSRDEAIAARNKFRHPRGDHLTRLAALKAYEDMSRTERAKGARKQWCRENWISERACAEILRIRQQVHGVCVGLDMGVGPFEEKELNVEHEEGLLRALTTGYAQNAAFLQPDGSYRQVMGMMVRRSRWQDFTNAHLSFL